MGLFGKKKTKGLRCPYCMSPLNYRKLHSFCFTCNEMVTPKGGRCPKCGGVTHEVCYWEEGGRKCGCGKVLPTNFENTQNVLIALVGPKQAGKSEYISVLFSYLKKHISREFGLFITAADDMTASKLNNDRRTNYAGRVVAVTDSILAGGTAGDPYVMSVKSAEKNITLVLYDTAGEDLKEIDTMRQGKIYDYIREADGVMFFADPLQFDSIRDNVEMDRSLFPVRDDSHDNYKVFCRVSQVLEENAGRKGVVQTNLALVMTKGDIVMKDDPASKEEFLAVRSQDPPCRLRERGTVDQDNIDGMSSFMDCYLKNVTHTELVDKIESTFSNHRTFLVSSLGHNPDGQSLIEEPDPFRIEDPLLWLISQCSDIMDRR